MSQPDGPYLAAPEHDYIYPQAVVLIVLSVIVALINIGPFFWHLKARNIPATCLVFWVIILNVCSFVNASIWHNDNTDTWWSGHVYCDIQSRVILAANVGTCGAVLCIMRSLAKVLDTKNTALSASDRQKKVDKIFTIVFCFAFPVYIMVVIYFVSPARYILYGIAGCVPVGDESWVTDVLVTMWPLILTTVDAGYAVLIIVRMQRYRSEFNSLLTFSNTTKSRFIRLFANTLIFILILLPLQIYSFVNIHRGPTHAYSFRKIHGPFWNYIFKFPSFGVVPVDHWVYIAMAVLVFAFFGTGSDAIGMYRGWLVKLRIMKPGVQSDKKSSFFGSRWSTLQKAKLLFSKSSGTESKGAAGFGSFDDTSLSSAATMQASPAAQPSSRHPTTAPEFGNIDADFVTSKESGVEARAVHDMV